jgi:hypothetical protein
VIAAHVLGLPVEESVLQLLPAGAALATAVAVAGRTALGRLRRRPTGDGREAELRHDRT